MCLRSDPLLKVMERLANPGMKSFVVFSSSGACMKTNSLVNPLNSGMLFTRGAPRVHCGGWKQACGRHNIAERYIQVLADELAEGVVSVLFPCKSCQS
jgi:hypothetical protein